MKLLDTLSDIQYKGYDFYRLSRLVIDDIISYSYIDLEITGDSYKIYSDRSIKILWYQGCYEES